MKIDLNRFRAPLRFQAGVFLDRKLFRGMPAPKAASEPEQGRRLPVRLWAAAGIGLILFAHWEMSTAALESRLFSSLASRMSYRVEPGKSPRITFPKSGPFDTRLGYSRVPEFAKRLEARGFEYQSQARFTKTMALVAGLGVPPPYPEPPVAGLVIDGSGGEPLYDAMGTRRTFARFEQIPPDVVKSLLFIENRELDRFDSPYANPAIDWSRSAKAMVIYAASRLGLPTPVEGGSTLAVQMEKYRHSPSGRTSGAVEKLRQMIGASLRVYRLGPRTVEERRRIVLDYVNTVPLGGTPRYGEVFGMDEGLRVWFGTAPEKVYAALAKTRVTKARARALKEVLALVCAVRAPSRYLVSDRDALEDRVDKFVKLMASRGLLEPKLAGAVIKTRLRFADVSTQRYRTQTDKATVLVRMRLRNLLGVPNLYDLDRLHVNVKTTVNAGLERDVTAFFHRMNDEGYVDSTGLKAAHLLLDGDPGRVVYSMILRERTPTGDVVRVHADNVEGPFDVNEGTKMELGSTAKLRTLVHYLNVMAELHQTLSALPDDVVRDRARASRDPLTQWAAETVRDNPGITLSDFLSKSLDRKYSASPYELFFTGGGLLTFENYDKSENSQILPIREAVVHSTNLVFIRLMRDLVRYHEARLPYDAEKILGPKDTPERTWMLRQVAAEEGTPEQMAWLFRTRNRAAQDNRLRARIERDAFARMTPYWRRLGFPFSRLVPSYATAIGSSSDQPAALADLMGVLVNDGVRRPPALIQEIAFASDTPYETRLDAPAPQGGDLLVPPEVARAARSVLGDVVERGTAARLRGAFVDSTGAPIWVGGKTGTGDNRFDTFGRGRRLLSSRAVSRTAAFAFCLGDRYYGVVTASVLGPEADQYTFTSVLPVEVLRRLAPTIEKRMHLVGGSAPAAMNAVAVAEGAGVPDDASTDSAAVTPATPPVAPQAGAAPAAGAPAASDDVKSGTPAQTGDTAVKERDDESRKREAERAKKRRDNDRRQWDWEAPSRTSAGGRL
ncbi:MAG TPA: transglycosylase domain-containing protein [Candidatus Binatia bacterium]|nr:transglycosylase domain-containing protein [Candidatus Binatia bacterium]